MRRTFFAVVLFFTYLAVVSYLYFTPIAVPYVGRHSDKLFHFLIFLFGGMVFIVVLRSPLSKLISFLFGATLLIAPFAMEYVQEFIPYRVYDPTDIIANYAGLAVPILVFVTALLIKRSTWVSWSIFIGLVAVLFYTRYDSTLARIFSRDVSLFFDIAVYFGLTLVALHIMFKSDVKPFSIIPEVIALVLPTFFSLDHRLTPRFTYTRRDIVFAYIGIFAAILIYSVHFLLKERAQTKQEIQQVVEEQSNNNKSSSSCS